MPKVAGVFWAGAAWRPRRERETLAAKGFGGDVLAGLGSNELVLAVRAADEESASAALDAGAEAAFAEEEAGDVPQRSAPRTLTRAAAQLPGANVAIVSVAGDYAALEAHHALTVGCTCCSSATTSRSRRRSSSRIAPTASGCSSWGRAPVPRSSPAPGWASPTRCAAGRSGWSRRPAPARRKCRRCSTGGASGSRTSSGSAGGTCPPTSAAGWPRPAVRALEADSETDGDPARVQAAGRGGGARGPRRMCRHARGGHLPRGDRAGRHRYGPPRPDARDRCARGGATRRHDAGDAVDRSARPRGAAPAGHRSRRAGPCAGYFSGGTLCYEAQLIIGELLGAVYSNEPLVHEHTLPAPAGAHILLDLGRGGVHRRPAAPDDRSRPRAST